MADDIEVVISEMEDIIDRLESCMGDKSFTEWQIELINDLRQLTKLEFSEYIN